MLTLHPGATNTNDVALRSERIVAERFVRSGGQQFCVPVPVNLPYKRSRERREILEIGHWLLHQLSSITPCGRLHQRKRFADHGSCGKPNTISVVHAGNADAHTTATHTISPMIRIRHAIPARALTPEIATE